MKAQVLHKYDPEMKEKVWVTEQEMPDPKLEKSSDGARVRYKYTCCENPTNNCAMMTTPIYKIVQMETLII